MLLQLYEYLLHNIRFFLLLYQRKNLLFKDTTLYNPVVRPVGFTIFWRVTDGIFTYRKDTVDELPVLVVLGQVQLHPVNRTNHLVPAFVPFIHRWTPGGIGTADKGIQQ